jgi:beta-lactamase regulating signal transducer with metallopeptidase domain/polyhydroxyalkanoate synthesis regulator phasin
VIDLLLKIGLSNACFALAMAIVAVVVGKTTRRPDLANLLWLLVLLKLVTPPLVTIPGVSFSGQSETVVAVAEHYQPPAPSASDESFDASHSSPPLAAGRQISGENPTAPLSARLTTAFKLARQWAPPLWLLGSMIVLIWSLVRVSRFSRLLKAEAQPAPEHLQTAAVRIARRLRLRNIPTICTTKARLSPMVWWTGGKVRVVIPTTLIEQLEPKQLKWVLAHELSHVRRRDYLVRWIEWLACVGFWWNPVAWWAQRNLRATEEICCDALVLSSLNPKPNSYAQSILKAVESLVRPAVRPPAMASEINSGGFLERRFKMIVSVSKNPGRSKSRWLQACVLLCAIVVLPLGVASAQDIEAVWNRLQTAVKHGEISPQQSHIMMGALKGSMYTGKKDDHRGGKPDHERAEAHMKEIWGKLQHAVKEGKISQEDAHKKMGEIKKQIHAKLQGGARRGGEHKKGGSTLEEIGRWVHSVGEDIRKAKESGKITGEQAMQKWQGFKEHQLAPKLKAAVKKGLVPEQAAMDFWRHIEAAEAKERAKHGQKNKPAHAERKGPHAGNEQEQVHARLQAIWERLQNAVREGKMSKEDAGRKMGEIKREALSKFNRAKSDPAREHLMKIRRELGAAVQAGKISKADAAKKFAGAEKAVREKMAHARKQRGGEPKRFTEEDLPRIGVEIRKAVAAGKITPEQGRAKMAAVRNMISQQPDRGAEKGPMPDRAREYLMKVRKDLGAAVEAGKISREDAGKKFAAAEKTVRARIAHAKSQRGDKKAPAGKPAALNWDHIKMRIEGAVKRGDMTRKQADAKYAEIKRNMGAKKAQPRKPAALNWDNIKMRIEGAVKRGDMTREQANAKYREIKQRMGKQAPEPKREHHKR